MMNENWPDDAQPASENNSQASEEIALPEPLDLRPEYQEMPELPSLDEPTEFLIKGENSPPLLSSPDITATQTQLQQLVATSLADLEAQRAGLIREIEKLERRRERIQKELKQNFVGASQDLAIRIQGFKDYLVNSLQDLATTAEQLELIPTIPPTPATPTAAPETKGTAKLHLAEESFQEEAKRIQKLIEQYRQNPNYYGPAWQLRRTFEPIHAERVETWFFDLGGRGALRSMNSRLQNILVAAAIISILRDFYDDTLRVLILADSPERLGDWRRGLQDCLGITRTDFGPDRGVALFESADALAFRADRLEQDDYLPLILIDDSQESVNLSMLQFPLLLGFAPEPQLRQPKSGGLDFFE
ncbi:DUF3086 domain-containing protein [Thermosynechococcaceae cyanobacterium BACA0444]|uniref:DUF3086 domain-containing protein n=1 Tax=Pseudocalidococcus azoricus BACA0444 TaxID=2918990 RepID=A0AAE4JV96_9CYAN|nr:DUF3086 domain-containing protein [Pseudocalidococcus azoricus]MDS3860115.1 DUF3086 domain-containing protein [Pseudocalidococcus azoricus BACA0444]